MHSRRPHAPLRVAANRFTARTDRVNLELASRLEADIDQALEHGDMDRAEDLARQYVSAAPGPGNDAASPGFRARYLSARVALEAGRLEEAARRLGALVPLPNDLPEPLACRLWLMSAEALARLRRLPQARGHLVRAQYHAAALAAQPTLKLRELRIRLWLGERDTLAGELAALRAALETRRDWANLALLLCEEGRAHDAAGDLARAEACWRQGLALPCGAGPDAVRADLLVQVGRLEHLHGRLQPALDRYDEAAARAAVPAQAQEARLRRILVLLELNQPGQARAELERLLPAGCETIAEEVRPLAGMVAALVHGGQAQQRQARAFAAARRGDWEEARELYRQELNEAAGPVRQARLGLALGMLALAAGDRAEARRRLDQAIDQARRLGLPEVLAGALQARGQLAAEADRDDETARRLYEEAVLVSEKQARTLRHRTDALAHGLRRGDVLRRLVLAACRRQDAPAVFRYQELERGRLLLELWRAAPGRSSRQLGDHPALAPVEQQLLAVEAEVARGAPEEVLARRDGLLLQRDRLLDEHLRDRSRADAAVLPVLPELAELERALPASSLYVAPVLAREELHLLVCGAGRPARLIQAAGSAAEVAAQVEALRRCLGGQLERYRQGLPLGRPERGEIDARLDDLGGGPLGQALWRVLDEAGAARLVWVPDGVLHGLPVAGLRRGGRYLVEQHDVVFTFGGALFFHHLAHPAGTRTFGPAVVLSEAPAVLPMAARECEGVAAAFWRSRHLTGAAASREALRLCLRSARVVHLACHAYFDPEHPLSAHIGLPSGESWRALDWLDEPLEGLPLVTLSACRSAEVGPLVGREVFGLVSGLLGSGVRGVLAGLWPVADREAGPFMWRFYRQRMTEDVPAALAAAQRQALAAADGSPLFWAAFAYFGDPAALPAPGGLFRRLARWRQARHARRFSQIDQPHSVGA